MRDHRAERGQVLVLIILAIVGIFGFAALAVDGGMIFVERRKAQNAADAAALSAAAAFSKGQNTFTAAMAMLASNGYDADNDPNTNPAKAQDVQVFHPPISGPYANNNEYFQVLIRTRVDKIFAQMVFSGPEEMTVEAVTRMVPSNSVSPGQAMHAIGRDVCPGIVFNGGSNTHIVGGNIFSNSNGHDTSGSCASGIMTGSSGNIKVDSGDINISGSWISNAGATISPAPKTNVDPIYPGAPTPPSCTGLPSRTDASTHLLPGYYSTGINIMSGNYTMDPGLYCIGGGFTVNGGSLVGHGVVIYMMPTAGGLSLSGSADITLTTGSVVLDGNNVNKGGYLIFMDQANHNGVDMAGNNGSFYQGTIYAPGYRDPASKEKCNIGGSNTSVALHSNIICYTIGIAGNSSVTIDYKKEENYQNPPSIELSQ